MNAIVQTKAVQNALETIRATATQLRSQIAQKQSEHQECESEIRRLQSMPVCFDDWLPRLKNYITHCGRRAAPTGSLLSARSPTKAPNELGWNAGSSVEYLFHELGGNPERNGSGFDMLCLYFPDVVFEKLSAHYRASAGSKWGNEAHPRVAERETRIKALNAQTTALQAELADLREQLAPLEAAC